MLPHKLTLLLKATLMRKCDRNIGAHTLVLEAVVDGIEETSVTCHNILHTFVAQTSKYVSSCSF